MKNRFTLAALVALSLTLTACNGSIPDSSSDYSSILPALSSIDNSVIPAEAPDIALDNDVTSIVPEAITEKAQISVYNAGGHLINIISKENALAALNDMLTDAPVYSGEDLHLKNAPYCLEMQGDSSASYDLWLRNDNIYFMVAGESTVYSPVNIDISEFKQIINDKY